MPTSNEAERNREKAAESDVLIGKKNRFDAISFNLLDAFKCVFSLILYLTDVGTDITLAWNYYVTKDYQFFGLTLLFILLPAAVMSLVSYGEYRNQINYTHKFGYRKASKLHWIIRKICLVFCISPAQCYFDALYYGYKYNQVAKLQSKLMDNMPQEERKKLEQEKESYAVLLYVEKRTTSILRLIEAFSECAPQMILQLYIIATGTYQYEKDTFTVLMQYSSIISSTFSLAWAVATIRQYTMLVDIQDRETSLEEPPWLVTITLFFAHFLEIGARSLAIGLFAASVGWIVWPVILTRIFTSFGLLLYLMPKITFKQLEHRAQKDFTPSERLRLLFLVAIVVIFTFMHSNRFRARYYYAICFVENAIMISLWFALSTTSERYYQYLIFVGHYVLFFTSNGVMVLFCKFENWLDKTGRNLNKQLKDCFSSCFNDAGDSWSDVHTSKPITVAINGGK